MNKSQQTYNARTRYGVELRNTVNMLETHDLGHSIYRSVVRLLQTFLQVSSQRIDEWCSMRLLDACLSK